MLRRIAKAMAAMFAAVALVGAGAWLWISWTAASSITSSLDTIAPAKAALVLGTSPKVRSGRPNAFFEHRMDAAADLFRANKVEYVIVSGNQARGGRAAGGYDEPAAMRDALMARGVPESRIYRDYAGFHTRDSVARARDIFGQTDPIVVSQKFHIERAIFLAQAHGMAFRGYPAADVSAYYGAMTFAREIGSRIVALTDWVFTRGARFGGAPVRLGTDQPT